MKSYFFIYKIFCKSNPNEFYIGSTININSRIKQHKRDYNSVKNGKSKLYTFIRNNGGINNFEVEILETYYQTFEEEDWKQERSYIEEIHIRFEKPTLNTLSIWSWRNKFFR